MCKYGGMKIIKKDLLNTSSPSSYGIQKRKRVILDSGNYDWVRTHVDLDSGGGRESKWKSCQEGRITHFGKGTGDSSSVSWAIWHNWTKEEMKRGNLFWMHSQIEPKPWVKVQLRFKLPTDLRNQLWPWESPCNGQILCQALTLTTTEWATPARAKIFFFPKSLPQHVHYSIGSKFNNSLGLRE